MNPEFGVLRRGLGINIDLNYKFNYPKSGGGGGGREAGCSLVTRGGAFAFWVNRGEWQQQL